MYNHSNSCLHSCLSFSSILGFFFTMHSIPYMICQSTLNQLYFGAINLNCTNGILQQILLTQCLKWW